MSRRRLLVVTSSDDEDDAQQRTQTHSQPPQQFGIRQSQDEEEEEIEVQYQNSLPDIEAVALGSSSGPIQPQLIADDDEDFVDVSDHFTPPSPPPPQQPHMPSSENSLPASVAPSSNGPSQCPVSEIFRGLGLNLRDQWLESCIQGLETAVPGFSGFDSVTKAKYCFEQFLYSDMNFIGGGVLPLNVDSMHLVELAGPFVLQVDEVVNLSCPLRDRYKNSAAGPKRCLKLSMTDGIQRVFGMEYRPINDLQVLGLAGFKVAIKNVVVRRGLLMLVPEVLEVLGGSVEELEAARQRLVAEINKPPRGKRTRHGVLPPLATRATMAAWPQTGADNPVQNNTSAQQSNNSTRQDVQGAGISTNNPGQNNTSAQHSNYSTRQDVQGAGINTNNPVLNNTFAQHPNYSIRQDVQGIGINTNNPVQSNTFAQRSNYSTGQDVQGASMNTDIPVQNDTFFQDSNYSSHQDVQGAGINTNYPVQNNSFAQDGNYSTRQDVQDAGLNMNIPIQNDNFAQDSDHSTHQDVQGSGINTNYPVQSNTFAQDCNSSTHQDVLGAGINNKYPIENNTSAQHSNYSDRQDVQGSAPSGSGINTPRTTADSGASSTEFDDLPFTRDPTDHNSTRDSTVISSTAMDAEDNFGSTVQDIDDVEMDDPTRDATDHNSTRESTLISTSGIAAEDNFGSTFQDVEDVEMADPTHHPHMLIGDRELPFTYLTSLSAKFDFLKGKESHVRGKIKCFITSVIGLQYKGMDTYDLRVFVEDGSLIQEVKIHHDVVEKLLSHTPGELTAALTSSDKERVVNAKKCIGKFQDFLADFEGYLLIEMNESSELPVVLEMTQGCPASDASSLLNRCLSPQTHLDPIVLSP